MNKYQEVLDFIKNIVIDELSNGYDDPKHLIDFYPNEVNVLQELVDKEKPMKPLHISLLSNPAQNIIACGNCKGNNLGQSFKYCPSCGQKIDWNMKNEHIKKYYFGIE